MNRKSSLRRSTRNREYRIADQTEPFCYDVVKNNVTSVTKELYKVLKLLKGCKQDRPDIKPIKEYIDKHIHKKVTQLYKDFKVPYIYIEEEELENLNRGFEQAKKESNNMKRRFEQAEKESKDKDEHVKRLRYERDGKAKDLTDIQDKNKELKKEKERFQYECQRLREERDKLQGSFDEKEIRIRNWDEERKQEICSLKTQIQKLEEGNTNQEQEIHSQKAKIKELEEENRNQLKGVQLKMSQVIQQKAAEVERFNTAYKESVNEKTRLSQELQQYKTFVQELHTEKENEKENYEHQIQRYVNELQNLRRELNEEKKEKDEALTRLSAIAGDRLRNNNPGIADLSDPNRPMKIAEKFTEMYDNDWTDAMEALEELGLDEKQCVEILLHFLTDSYDECGQLVTQLDRNIGQAVMVTANTHSMNGTGDAGAGSQEDVPDIPAEICKPIKDLRRKLTPNTVEELQKILPNILRDKRSLTDKQISVCKAFIDDCIRYTWMMQIQDPPVYIDWDFPRETKIDTNIFRSYTKAGDEVDFLVWPALYLHKDGPILNKGVVQPITNK